VALAQPLLDVLEIESLRSLLNEFKKKANLSQPTGGIAPDWTNVATLSDFGFLRSQRDALLSALAQAEALVEGGGNAIDRLFSIIEQKLRTLDSVVEEFSSLLSKLQSTLDASGVYTFYVDGFGGNDFIKQQLRVVSNSASNLFKEEGGYTFGFLLVGGGPSLLAVRLLNDLLLSARIQNILGGSNAKQRVDFSAVPADPTSSITFGNVEVPVSSDPVTFRKDLQSGLNSSGLSTEALVVLSTSGRAENGNLTVGEYNALPDILSSEKDGLGFVVEFQGVDGRTPQPLLDFSDPGLDEIQEICFSETPTSGYMIVSYEGQDTPNIPFSASASDLQEALNNLPKIFNKTSVTGSYVDCFTVTFKKMDASILSVQSFLVGPSGPVTVSVSVIQAGKNPANNIRDVNGRPISITVTELVPGRKNDLC
jgi:hypothetical protein